LRHPEALLKAALQQGDPLMAGRSGKRRILLNKGTTLRTVSWPVALQAI
jgi:hypothetical protein